MDTQYEKFSYEQHAHLNSIEIASIGNPIEVQGIF